MNGSDFNQLRGSEMSVAANSQPTLTWASLVTDAYASAEALHEALITCQRLPGPGSVPTRYSWDSGSMLEQVGTVEATAEKLAAQTAKAKQLHAEMVKAFEVIAPLLEIAITSQYQLPPLTLPAVAHFSDWFGDNHTPGGEYQFASEALGRVFMRTERLRWGLPSHFLAASEAITTPKEARDATQAETVTQYQVRAASQSYFVAWQAEVSQRISRERAMCRQAIMQGAAQFLPSPSMSSRTINANDHRTLSDLVIEAAAKLPGTHATMLRAIHESVDGLTYREMTSEKYLAAFGDDLPTPKNATNLASKIRRGLEEINAGILLSKPKRGGKVRVVKFGSEE